jgi:hypothetical protein
VVINPLRVKALLRVEGKSDRADSVTLARLAASFDIRPSNMPDDLQREARTYWRQIDLDKTNEQRLLQRLTAMLIAHGTTVTRVLSNRSQVYLEVLRRIAAGALGSSPVMWSAGASCSSGKPRTATSA